MNNILRKSAFFLIYFVLIGRCYAASPHLIPLENSSERISGLGLSILPPQGKDWYVIADNPNGGLMFSKRIDGPAHTFVCSFTVVPTDKDFKDKDKFLEVVKHMQENFTDENRFQDIKSNYNLNERFGSFSVEYQISVTDIGRKKKGVPLVTKMHGYSFVHSKDPYYLVDIVYSERSIDEDFTPELQKVGKEFIDNLIVEK